MISDRLRSWIRGLVGAALFGAGLWVLRRELSEHASAIPHAFAEVPNRIIFLALLILAGCTTAAVTLMLVVRRRAPDGSYFSDGDRAAGAFGVLATGFFLLLGFVVFLAFTSYDSARAGAEEVEVTTPSSGPTGFPVRASTTREPESSMASSRR